jgi:hypothetical protein
LQAKTHGAAQQVGQGQEQHADDGERHRGGKTEGVVVQAQHHHRHHAPAQNRQRIATEIEHRSANACVAVKILQAPHLGPGRIDAQGGDDQHQVDDPDAEIFLAATGEQRTEDVGLARRTGGKCHFRQRLRVRRAAF